MPPMPPTPPIPSPAPAPGGPTGGREPAPSPKRPRLCSFGASAPSSSSSSSGPGRTRNSPLDPFGTRWALEGGMLLRIDLTDFLCHEHLLYEPRSGLNFLSGVNGSGKSAVLSAVVFALGGSAKHSRKGATNASLIRHGARTAKAKVTLYNGGGSPYRPQIFGKEITVCRSISHAGSGSYQILTAAGKALTPALLSGNCTSVRQELTAILSHFMIQVDNPLTLLPQDLAKAFLAEFDSNQLYGFYLRATQLDDCKSAIEAAKEEEERAKYLFDSKAAALPNLEKLRETWARKKEFHSNLEDRRSRLVDKQREYQWALVGLEENRWKKKDRERTQYEEKIKICNFGIQKIESEKEALKQRQASLAEQLGILKSGHGTAKDSRGIEEDDVKREVQLKKEGIRELKRELKTVQESVVKQGEAVERLKNVKMRHLETMSASSNAKQKRETALSELQTSLSTKKEELTSQQTHLNNLQNDEENAKGRLDDAKGEVGSLRSKIGNQEKSLRQLREDGGNRLVLLHDRLPELVYEMNKQKKSFSVLPIGPIGTEIKLASVTTNEQAAVIEKELKNLLTTFIVDSFADRKVLETLQSRLRVHFPIIVMSFGKAKKYRIDEGKCSNVVGSPCLYDLLEIENPVVSNCLVDQARIEGILIIPEDADAQRLLTDERRVPKNCYYAVTHTFNQLYPAPNYRCYAQDRRKSSGNRVLHPNITSAIKEKEHDLGSLRSQLLQAEAQLEEALARRKQTMDELLLSRNSCNKLKGEIRSLNEQIGRLQTDEEASRSTELEVLEEEYQVANSKREALLSDSVRMEAQIVEAIGAMRTAEEAYTEFRKNKINIEVKAEPIQREIRNISEQMEELETKKGKFMDRKEQVFPKIRQVLTEIKKLAAKSDDMRSKLKDAAKPESVRAPEKVLKEISNLERLLKTQEHQVEPFDQVLEELSKVSRKYTHVKRSLVVLHRRLKSLASMVKRRHEGYIYIRNSMTRRIQLTFSTKLTRRGFSGWVNLDHQDQKLILTVCPTGSDHLPRRDMRTLSGGEKSYSTIALILSLWECMQPPFRILDEFDVFMDMVNRKVAIQQILEYAKESRKYQYIFLTPLNTDMVAKDEECFVVKLQKK